MKMFPRDCIRCSQLIQFDMSIYGYTNICKINNMQVDDCDRAFKLYNCPLDNMVDDELNDIVTNLRESDTRVSKTLVNYSNTDLYKVLNEYKEKLKKINQNKDINEQILISNPYRYSKIIDKMHNYVMELFFTKVKDATGLFILGWDESVLIKENNNETK